MQNLRASQSISAPWHSYYHLDVDADDDGEDAKARGGEDIVGTRIDATAAGELGSGGGAEVAVSASRARDHLFDLIDAVLDDLAAAGCVTIEDDFLVAPTTHGHIASCTLCMSDPGGNTLVFRPVSRPHTDYYLDYRTVRIARDSLPRVRADGGFDKESGMSTPALLEELCRLLSDVQEASRLAAAFRQSYAIV